MPARLVKLIVQAVVVLDDGTDLTEVGIQPFEVAARDVATLTETVLPQLLARVDKETEVPMGGEEVKT